MKDHLHLESSLADRMIDFIAFKRMHGYDYTSQIAFLKRLDKFLIENECTDSILHIEDLQRYCAEAAELKPGSQSNIYSALRQFSLYLRIFEPQSAVLPKHQQPRKAPAIRFHPLSTEQISRLMSATEILAAKNGIWSHCICFLIGLLYSTGLRIGEAIALNLQDVDIKNATIFVRQGKNRKERIVPISPSTLKAMKEWLNRRKAYAGNETALLIASWNKRLSYAQAISAFGHLRRHCNLDSDPPPRLHDLRHNYACRRIALWREAHEDVNTLLPLLVNAMGHINVCATQVYLHVDAGSLQQASSKFNTYVNPHQEHSK
ncbi:MAG: hypothetical protein EOM20_08005 [Spartobacteria bacterium]|nr:hypothetical protein [Spartobacteria bacterium]